MTSDPDFLDFTADTGIGVRGQRTAPTMTQWKLKWKLFNIHCVYIPELKAHFLNHWKVSLGMPILVNFIIISSYCVFLFVVDPLIHFPIWHNLIITVTCALFLISYYMIIIIGPGYLPYYYPMELSYDKKDYWSGIASNVEKVLYAQTCPPIPRTKFFRSVYRFVIRPDHFCGWTSTFIGKKNHKFFFLFNFWGMIYILWFTITDIYGMVKVIEKNMAFKLPIVLIYVILGVFFFFMTCSFAVTTFANTAQNVTQFERMSKVRGRRGNIIKNLEEVFGTRKKWYLWLLPVPAFNVKRDEYLLDSESEYKMI